MHEYPNCTLVVTNFLARNSRAERNEIEGMVDVCLDSRRLGKANCVGIEEQP